MDIHLSPDGVPKYLQIVNQVKYLVASGRLRGEELPTIRALAQRLVINPNTVAKAYRELERDGVVTTRGAAGTFVADAGSPLARAECLKLLTERLDALLAEARAMNVGFDELLTLLRRRHQLLQPPSREDRANDHS